MNARIGNYDVLESGSLVVQPASIVTLKIGNEPLVFRFIFNDEVGKEQIMRTAVSADKQSMDATFTNFNSPTGTGSSEPIQLGTFGENPERPLYLNFAIYGIGTAGNKVVYYTFLLGQAIK